VGQANSTLILHPYGLSGITFSTLEAGSTGYYVHPNSLRFNEEDREQMFYSGGANVDGGEFVSSYGPLVDVEFTALVFGSTRAQMIQRAQALKHAIGNENGGTLEYKPEGITTRSTFYHYVKSPTPRLAKMDENIWEGNPKISQSQGQIYVAGFDVVLRTLPAATSDPDNLVSLSLSRSTLDNTHDTGEGQYNFFDIDGDDIVGDLSAYTRLMVRNSQSNDYEKIGRVYVTARSEYYSTFASLIQIYESDAASVVQYSQFWSTESDSDRSNGSYLLCASPASENEQILRFSISNETDHRGRVAILACISACGSGYNAWRIKARYRAASDTIVESTPETQPEDFTRWHLVYCGELDFPPTSIDTTESISPYIDLVLTRNTGNVSDTIAIDFIALLFMDESVVQFDVDDGFGNSEKLLSMQLASGKDIAHVVNQATLELNRIVDRKYGSPTIVARPGFDTRVMMLFERIYSAPLIDEDFESYEGLYWFLITGFEGTWWLTGAAPDGEADTTHFVEGTQGWGDDTNPPTTPRLRYSPFNDYSNDGRFTDDDFVCCAIWVEDPSDLVASPLHATGILFETWPGVNNYYGFYWDQGDLSTGWNLLSELKSNAVESGSPSSWETIQSVLFSWVIAVPTSQVTFDYAFCCKADPDDAASPNPTGPVWDFQPSNWGWTIAKDGPDGSSDAVLACMDNEASIEKMAMYDGSLQDNVCGFCKVSAITDTGYIGLAFRITDITSGSEDCYVFALNLSNDNAYFNKLVAGASSAVATNVDTDDTLTSDTWYWLGFEAKGSQLNLYYSDTEPEGDTNSEKLRNLLDFSNRLFSETDASHPSGDVGFYCYEALGRFDDLYVESLEDRHVPADQVTIQAAALMRTIYPFPD